MKIIKKIGYWFLMFLVLCAINTSSIVWLCYNFISSPQVPELSLWDIGVLKTELDLAPSEYLSAAEKGTIYLFMIVGLIITIFFIKWLFIDTITQFREKIKEKNKEFKKYKKELKNES